jgi:Cdc6-like AAA superfamily ATPase
MNTLKVYPNPANDVVIINNGDYSTMTNYTIKIVNDLGQEIFNSIVNTQEFQIPVSAFGAEGLYYIQIFDDNNTLLETKKLVLN